MRVSVSRPGGPGVKSFPKRFNRHWQIIAGAEAGRPGEGTSIYAIVMAAIILLFSLSACGRNTGIHYFYRLDADVLSHGQHIYGTAYIDEIVYAGPGVLALLGDPGIWRVGTNTQAISIPLPAHDYLIVRPNPLGTTNGYHPLPFILVPFAASQAYNKFPDVRLNNLDGRYYAPQRILNALNQMPQPVLIPREVYPQITLTDTGIEIPADLGKPLDPRDFFDTSQGNVSDVQLYLTSINALPKMKFTTIE